MRLKPRTPGLRVKHFTTEPRGTLELNDSLAYDSMGCKTKIDVIDLWLFEDFYGMMHVTVLIFLLQKHCLYTRTTSQTIHCFNSLPTDKILNWTKLKAFADTNLMLPI